MISPSMTTSPMASAQLICDAMEKATKAFSPSPVASASGKLATTPIRIVSTPATRAVAAATIARFGAAPPPRKLPSASGTRADDQRVQHDDVGHREERHEPTADLARDASSPAPRSRRSGPGRFVGRRGVSRSPLIDAVFVPDMVPRRWVRHRVRCGAGNRPDSRVPDIACAHADAAPSRSRAAGDRRRHDRDGRDRSVGGRPGRVPGLPRPARRRRERETGSGSSWPARSWA